jgi:hypothetical protein
LSMETLWLLVTWVNKEASIMVCHHPIRTTTCRLLVSKQMEPATCI